METVTVNFDHFTCRRRYVTMIFDLVYINAPQDIYPECNQILISGNGTPVREIDAQTEKQKNPKKHGITHSITDVQSLVSMKVTGGCVGMGDIRKYFFIRAGTWRRQFPSKHYRHYILHSHHRYHSLIQSASRQPTVYFSLLVDFTCHLVNTSFPFVSIWL